jgi:crossover junction endodeoxyribonuclease RuvC
MANKTNRKLWADYLEKKEKNPGAISNVSNTQSLGASFSGVVLGIDPSLRGAGFAVIRYEKVKAELLDKATLKLGQKFTMDECLGKIAKQVEDLVEGYTIDHVAVEQTIYVQNFQVAQIMGAAKGAAIAPAAMRGLPVFEYAPLRIKQAVVGNGRASKEQVAKMVGRFLNVDFEAAYDESDASAVAMCHAFTWRAEAKN